MLRIFVERLARTSVAFAETLLSIDIEIPTENATLNETSPSNAVPAGVAISTSKIRWFALGLLLVWCPIEFEVQHARQTVNPTP
jgi:hypothetical protein